MSILILTLLFGASLSFELTFTLQEHEVQCFHELIPKGKSFSIEYQVISGGKFDVDCHIASPSSKNLYKEQKQQYDVFSHVSEEDGEYTICFSNEFSTFAHKTVYFELDYEDDNMNAPGFDEEGAHATALTQLESSAYTIHEMLKHVSDYQTHHRMKERIGRELAEFLCDRVQNWSVGQTIIIIVVGFGQVYMLKKLFDKTPPRGGRVGI